MVFNSPTFHIDGGDPGVIHPASEALPVGGRRRETIGQIAPFLSRGALLVVLVVLLLRFAGEAVGTVQNHDGARWQIIGQGVKVEQTVVERQSFRVWRGDELPQLLLEARYRGGVARRQVDAASTFVKRAAIAEFRQLLAGRNDGHGVRISHRSLRFGVKLTDGIDFVVPQLHPVGQFGVGRKHVQYPAAQAEGSRSFHLRFPAVSQLHPSLQQRIDRRDTRPRLQATRRLDPRVPAKRKVRWEGETQRGRDGGNDQGRVRVGFFGGGQRRESGEPLIARSCVNRQTLERQHLRLRQQPNGSVLTQVGQQLVVQPAGVLQARGQHDHRTALQVPQGPHVQGLMLGVHRQRSANGGSFHVAQVLTHPGLCAYKRKQSG